MNVLRKIIFGVIWFVVIYFGLCLVLGGIAGGIAGANDPAHAHEAGAIAGRAIVHDNILYILGVAVIVAVAGAIKGFLPGTRSRGEPSR
jgi:hypothetical protein